MIYSSVFNKEIFENAIKVLKEDCKISRGFTSQIVGTNSFSATTTSIITYVLSKLGSLSVEEKECLKQDILSFKINKKGFYYNSIGNEDSVTVWSTAQSCLALFEIGTNEDLFFDSIEWLCDVQSKDGGWSYNGKEDEISRIGYCLYTIIVLYKTTNKNSKVDNAINKAIHFIKNYNPKDTCEKIIKYYLLTLFKIEDRNKIQEREIVVDFINENVDELANYTIVEPGSGIHHFYVPWYVPGVYMFFRKFLEPDHPIVLFLMKWFSNNIIDRKGWSSDIHNKKIYSWATALSVLCINFWNMDCQRKSIKIKKLNDIEVIKEQMLKIMEDNSMPIYMSACPLNGGKCNLRKKIELEYNDINIFLDIPYQNSYLTYEKQIRATVRKSGLNVVIAKNRQKSDVLLCKVCQLIQTCKYGIADISEESLNIPFELGLMYGLGKPCAILKRKNSKQPSDVQGIEYIQYENTDEINNQLRDWIKDNVK